MTLEILLAQPQHLLQPRLVGLHGGIVTGGSELFLEGRPERTMAVVAQRRGQAEICVAGVLLLADQTGVFQHPEVPRDAGLRQTDDGRELGDVQPFAIEHAKQA